MHLKAGILQRFIQVLLKIRQSARLKVPDLFAHIDLPRTGDLGVCADHFFPMCDPARQSAQCENHGEHIFRDPQRTIDYAAVKVHIGEEFAFDKVFITQSNIFQFQRHFQQ